MKAFFLCLGLLLPAACSFACLNEYYMINAEGRLIPMGNSWKLEELYKRHNPEREAAKLIALEKKLKKEKNYMLLSDYAVSLMKLGKTKEALEILKALYQHFPSEYRIVANLGTAYELNGQPDSALKYIQLDLKLNPEDHKGSEWIHLKILEAELALKKDPQWLKTHTVLQLTEVQKKDPGVQQHLLIQLHERVPFMPGPNELAGSLFVDLGDITAAIGTVAYARGYYRVAKEYYGIKDPALDEKIRKMSALIKKYASVEPKRTEHDKGMQEKVGNIRVDDILAESPPDWGNDGDPKKVNTNVSSLLAMADYTKTPEQVRDSMEANAGLINEPGLIPAVKDSFDKKALVHQQLQFEYNEQEPGSGNLSVWVYIGLAGLLAGIAAVIVVIRRRK
jgi:tetratricopeptide (TPR) repeat protein